MHIFSVQVVVSFGHNVHLRERGDDQLVHWCHGAPGVILLCLTMWKRYGEQKYFKVCTSFVHVSATSLYDYV